MDTFLIMHIILLLFLGKCSQVKNCTCVPLYDCEDDYSGEIYETRNTVYKCEDDLNICCINVSTRSTEDTTNKSKAKYQNRLLQCELPVQCIPLKNCESLTRMIKTSQNLQSTLEYLNTLVCGHNIKKEPKICCPDVIPNHKSIKKQLKPSPCDSAFQCVTLLECGPLMHLVNSEKPVTKGLLKFLKSQQCGLGKMYPKVCCKLSTDIKPKSTTQKFVTSGISTTEKAITTTMSLKEKSVFMNKIFSDFFDLMI